MTVRLMLAVRRSWLFAAALIALFALISVSVSRAANISVDEDCSLSEAIHAANNDHEFDRCTAGDGDDTITLTGDITLSGRLPTITTDMTIDGSNFTVSGDDSTAIFSISDATVTLQNITITNGRTGARGGAIHVDRGTLILRNAVVKDSWAGDAGGGIYASNSTVNIYGSQIKDNTAMRSGGAGLYFTSESSVHTLNIEELSSFSGNVASQDGGAVRVAGGIAEFDKSSFTDNQADEGGVIEIWNGRLKIENSTLSGNHAREGGAINAGADSDFTTEVTIIHVTMANNTADERGASIAITGSQATLSIGNTIIAGETAEGVTQCHPGVSEYSVIAWVMNAISDNSCPLLVEEEDATATPSPTATEAPSSQSAQFVAASTELPGSTATPAAEAQHVESEEEARDEVASVANVVLGEPRIFKGVTYFPLEQGSPGIDTADQQLCEDLRDPDTDFMDTTRPQGDGCDIGAFELPWAEPTPIPRAEPRRQPTARPQPTAEEEPRDCVYIVQPGDSLIPIAEKQNTSVEDLRLLNRLTDDLLSVGQALDLPGCAPDKIDPDSPAHPYICDDIPAEIVIRSRDLDVRCEVVEIGELDKHPLMNAGIEIAAAVWGRTDAGVEACFADGGSLVFMDTSASPPAVSRLSLYTSGELACGRITTSGTVVYVSPLQEDASIPLSDCRVTTTNVLRLRDEAGGQNVLALAPFRVTMPANARTASWFFVEFMGLDGWISADYVQTEGLCE
ncbi:MAG: LysM peptidoglycan-binding domain-containing protein [Chloroflexi bacterium]|nr:LysM peptidoglycan-binding domain-containing protein [Chloroflexota bacterium]